MASLNESFLCSNTNFRRNKIKRVKIDTIMPHLTVLEVIYHFSIGRIKRRSVINSFICQCIQDFNQSHYTKNFKRLLNI